MPYTKINKAQETMTIAIETTYSQMCYDLAYELNNRWRVDAIESNNSFYHKLEVEVAKKYVKIWVSHVPFKGDSKLPSRSIWMFVDKNNGFCYKPASTKAPAKGVRFGLYQLPAHPETCDKFGSFLYLR